MGAANRRTAAITVGFVLLAAPLGWSAATLNPGSFLRIEGDSTLHQWKSATSDLRVDFQAAAGAPKNLIDAVEASAIKGMDVHIPVAGLKSGESGLDKNMRKALRAEQFPEIVYHLDHYALVKSSTSPATTARTFGTLSISGQTKPAEISVEIAGAQDALEMKGFYTLKMSDFGIKPPTLMLGTIKVRDAVVIRFDLFVKGENL